MDVSLIIPIYGAESFLKKSLEEIREGILHRIQNFKESWELVLVIDASPDLSEDICRQFLNQNHPFSIQLLVNEKNSGKGVTVSRGMLAATGKYRIFTDCDLAYPMSEVYKVLETLKTGVDVAIASRTHKDTRYIISPTVTRHLYQRHLMSRMFSALVRYTSLIPETHDTQGGLKGFQASTAQFIFSQLKLTGFSFDVEVLYLAHVAKLKVVEVPITLHYHVGTTMSFLSDGLGMFLDICRIHWWRWKGHYQLEKTDR
ncbi:MAG: glycosyltransferase [Deltaproteobacteria bacterium]|nr:MAG: glycosyltransferase [Deltaproteobacteria bacterium]